MRQCTARCIIERLVVRAVQVVAYGSSIPPVPETARRCMQRIRPCGAALVRSLRLLRSQLHDSNEQPPYRDWLSKHEMLVTYGEPAGEWLLQTDAVWTMHETHRSSSRVSQSGD